MLRQILDKVFKKDDSGIKLKIEIDRDYVKLQGSGDHIRPSATIYVYIDDQPFNIFNFENENESEDMCFKALKSGHPLAINYEELKKYPFKANKVNIYSLNYEVLESCLDNILFSIKTEFKRYKKLIDKNKKMKEEWDELSKEKEIISYK